MSDEIIDREIKYEPNLAGTDYRNFGVQVIPPSRAYEENYDRIFRKKDDSLWDKWDKIKIPVPQEQMIQDPHSDDDRLIMRN